MDIREALDNLDPSNDDHWTGQGLPSVLAVSKLTGIAVMTRKQITDARPGFSRSDIAQVTDLTTESYVTNTALTPEAWREQLSHELEEVQAQLHVLDIKAERLTRQVDALTEEIDRANPPNLTADIQTYIQSQNEQRENRKDVEVVKPRSPLDAALTRSHSRAKQRPGYYAS